MKSTFNRQCAYVIRRDHRLVELSVQNRRLIRIFLRIDLLLLEFLHGLFKVTRVHCSISLFLTFRQLQQTENRVELPYRYSNVRMFPCAQIYIKKKRDNLAWRKTISQLQCITDDTGRRVWEDEMDTRVLTATLITLRNFISLYCMTIKCITYMVK